MALHGGGRVYRKKEQQVQGPGGRSGGLHAGSRKDAGGDGPCSLCYSERRSLWADPTHSASSVRTLPDVESSVAFWAGSPSPQF